MDDINIVLLGHTGAGKSSTGNTIMREKVFDNRTGAISQTSQFTQHICVKDGRQIRVADTPGFFDTRKVDVEKEILKHLSDFKPNVFLFVITLSNRFPPEVEATLDRIHKMLGPEVYRHSVVLFTSTDYLQRTSLDTFVDSYAHCKVRALLQRCGGRYVGFDNHAVGSKRDVQVENLMEQIDKIGDLSVYKLHPTTSEPSASGENVLSKVSNVLKGLGGLFQSCEKNGNTDVEKEDTESPVDESSRSALEDEKHKEEKPPGEQLLSSLPDLTSVQELDEIVRNIVKLTERIKIVEDKMNTGHGSAVLIAINIVLLAIIFYLAPLYWDTDCECNPVSVLNETEGAESSLSVLYTD